MKHDQASSRPSTNNLFSALKCLGPLFLLVFMFSCQPVEPNKTASSSAAEPAKNGKIAITTSSEDARKEYLAGRDLQEKLVRDGYRMRCYVPFGSQWYPYLMRRLAERPANVAFMTGNIIKEMVPRRA